jgi:excisionase family DNA binding protein
MMQVERKTLPSGGKYWAISGKLSRNWDRPGRDGSDVSPKLLKTRDAACYLGMSKWTLRNLVHDGVLHYVPGKHWRFSTEDLDDYIRRNREREDAL